MGFRNMDLYSTNIEVNTVGVCQLSSEALDSRLYESFYVVAKEGTYLFLTLLFILYNP